jgi:hypothetical protein
MRVIIIPRLLSKDMSEKLPESALFSPTDKRFSFWVTTIGNSADRESLGISSFEISSSGIGTRPSLDLIEMVTSVEGLHPLVPA